MPQYQLRGISVDFPHEAYECQLEYMSRVIEALQEGKNALLESPTGTGKTLCLLCASLAWKASTEKKEDVTLEAGDIENSLFGEVQLRDEKPKTWAEGLKEAFQEGQGNNGGRSTIIYSSRTHSQLAQVMGELRNTVYKPKVAILGSRQQLCAHPAISKMGAAQNQACRSAVRSRDCSWYNRVEPFLSRNPDANLEPLEIEELQKLGQHRGVCPFYLSREMATTADIVFMPYNYLIDARVRSALNDLSLENSVLIFDEAHNVESTCSDSSSCEISASLLGGAIEEAYQAEVIAVKKQEGQPQGHPAASGERNFFQIATDFKVMKEMLRAFEGAIAALDCKGQNGFTRPGIFIDELLKSIKVTDEEGIWALIRKMEEAEELICAEGDESGRRSKFGGQRLHTLADMFKTIAESLYSGDENEAPPVTMYRVHVRMEKGARKLNGFAELFPTLHYWCFMPGLAMQALSRMHVRSFLLTSGTLSPLNSFAAELRLQFPIQLENPHVIQPSQVWIGILGSGPTGVALNSSYANRENKAYKEDLGIAIANFSRIIPGGLLVFFPSYIALESCIESWKNTPLTATNTSTTWSKICNRKQAVIEPRDSSSFGQAADDFEQKLNDPLYTGAIFFAVCRGKVSEGLDFSDRAGRAVVITGIPFANARDAKVRLKQEVLNEVARKCGAAKRPPKGPALVALTGDRWYTQTAMRAVNQGMGRVIRHRRDYGAIILCDERFAAPSNQNQLSAWLRSHVQICPNFGQANASLTKFFREQQARAAEEQLLLGPHSLKPKIDDKNAAFSLAGGKTTHSAKRSTFSLSQVPTAMDASGLTKMTKMAAPKGKSTSLGSGGVQLSLLSATATSDTSSAQLQQSRPAELPKSTGVSNKSLADNLWASVDSDDLKFKHVIAGKENQPLTNKALSRLSKPQTAESKGGVEGTPLQTTDHHSRANTASLAKPGSQLMNSQRQPNGIRKVDGGSTQTARAGQKLEAKIKTEPSTIANAFTEGSCCKQTQSSDPKQFFTTLQQALPKAAFEEIRDGLKAFKAKSMANTELYKVVVRILFDCGQRQLLQGFAAFIQKSESESFARAVKQHMLQRKGGTADPSAHSARSGKQEGKSHVANSQGPQQRMSQSNQATKPCAICRKVPMAMPCIPRDCDHQACYSCWMKVLSSKTQCPICQAHVTEKLLDRVMVPL